MWNCRYCKKRCDSPKDFTEYSNTMDGIYKNNYDYNPSRKKQNLNNLWWYDFADMNTNKYSHQY